jgi:hypothetical protein
MTLTALNHAALNHATPNPTTAQAASSPRSDASLKAANTAATQAEDALKQIGQLQAAAQPDDVFTLQKLEALAQTALSQANGIVPEGQSSVHAAANNAGYLAQSALQKIAQRLASVSASPASVPPAEAQAANLLNKPLNLVA